MDIKLGNIGIESIQISNSHHLFVGPIKGLGHDSSTGEVIVVTTRDLTDQEKTKLISDLQSIPKIDQKKEERKLRKKSIMQKLGLSKKDVIDLSDLLADRTDD